MTKLWQKKGLALDKTIEEFETADDLWLDQYLVEADVYGSLAHATMLTKIGILTAGELATAKKGFKEILTLNAENNFKLKIGDEDIHTKVENYLTTNYGAVGKKIHTGRSRNDQVLLDLRLFSKEKLFKITNQVVDLAKTFADLAEKFASIPMPGYTHMQKAMPSSVGMWLGAFAEALTNDLDLLKTALEMVDQSPLGSGAAYGVTLPLDRKMVADLLGFKKVQTNSLYCQNSRGKIESVVVFSLLQVISDISRFASDLLLFTTAEFNYFEVDQKLTTGSSIMPQKRNLDIAELLRSKVHIVKGYLSQIFDTVVNLPSGYNRDFQDTKRPYLESFILIEKVLAVTEILVTNIKPKKENLVKAMSPELYATQAAYELVTKGLPFREAYKQIGENLEQLKQVNAEEALKQSQHLGGTGNLQINQLQKILDKYRKNLKTNSERYRNCLEKMITLS